MPCMKPTGDCTSVSGCADCDCDDTGGSTPVLPKCQDVSLVPGSYAYATVVVNNDGCISAITEGEAPVYTPDDCCGDGVGGEGTPGPRGPKGDTGAAATISIDPVIIEGSGTSWTVENTGTSSAAIFKFTSPASTADDCCPEGFTGTVCGLQTVDGVVKSLPTGLVTGINVNTTGEKSTYIVLSAGLDTTTSTPCDVVITLNLDGFYYHIKQYIDDELTAISQRLDSIQFGVKINGNVATNTSSSDVIISVRKTDGTTVSTLTVPANSYVTLPNTTGAVYLVYQGSTLLNSYTTTA